MSSSVEGWKSNRQLSQTVLKFWNDSPNQLAADLVLQQQQVIEQLIGEVERLKSLLNKDSKTSSKPPSSDLIRRSTEKTVEGIRFAETKTRRTTGTQRENPKRYGASRPVCSSRTSKLSEL
ncbi:DUF6444 domain-containing protein [Moorena producens]|uniref:DUF6444 domain-containing protein n=1 Tax=Moorena producens TaxID=1155739 RepID=UPI003C770ABF